MNHAKSAVVFLCVFFQHQIRWRKLLQRLMNYHR